LSLSNEAGSNDPLETGAWLKTSSNKVALAPFADIAFLWFIGVLRDRLGELEDRFFATVFFGSGLLFLWIDGDCSLICLRRHYLAVFGAPGSPFSVVKFTLPDRRPERSAGQILACGAAWMGLIKRVSSRNICECELIVQK